jgi:hypothetical protein
MQAGYGVSILGHADLLDQPAGAFVRHR